MNKNRNIAIDFVKGCAVIVMIVHHSLNYYPIDFPLIKYMRFVTGAFIFIAGFIVTHFYITKYDINDRSMYFRLFTRAIKLLIIFTIINILIKLILNNGITLNNLNFKIISHHIPDIYLWGNYEMFYFDLLVPIAYVLIIVSLLIFLMKKNLWLLNYIALALFILCSVYFIDNSGGYYFRYMTIGLVGASLGLVQHKKLDIISKYWHVIMVIYIIHAVLLPIMKLYFPLYTLIVILNMFFFYLLGLQANVNNWFINKIILLGKYSLISYLFQIALLQALKRMTSLSFIEINKTLIAFLIVTLITYLFIEIVEYFRKQSNFINKCYKLFFA